MRRRFPSAILFGLAWAGVFAAVAGDVDVPRDIPDPAVVARRLPQGARSSDGFVQVYAAELPGDDKMGFRDPILRYVSDVVQSLGKTLGLPNLPRRSGAGLVVVAQDGRTNDARVVTRVFRNRRLGWSETRIYLPSPGYADLETLRFEVARAYFRAAVESQLVFPRPPKAPAPAAVPDWIVDGALSQTDIALVRDDLRAVLDGWSEGKFPHFPTLCADGNVPPVLADYLVGWMREKQLFLRLLADLAAGRTWDGPTLAKELTGVADPVEQEVASDYRLLRLMRKVIEPGTTSRLDLRIFASRLLLYPRFYDKMFSNGRALCSFREAAEALSDDPEVRFAARRKARELPLYALGRGQGLQEVSLAYRTFLLALAEGEGPGRLLAKLDEADIKLATVRQMVEKKEKEGK